MEEPKITPRGDLTIDELRHALDLSSIVAFTDSKGIITYVNDKFCEVSKYSREELIGQTHRIINSGHHSKEFFASLWKTIASGETWNGEIKNRAKDGSYYWVFTTIVPFLNDSGRPSKYVAIRTEITEQKIIQEAAERQRAALVQSEKMASVGELAAGIAHELGNPLAAVIGRAEFLRMQISSGKAGPAETLKVIDTIEGLCDRMTAIIRGMRAMSRDGTGDPFQRVSLSQVVQDVLGFSWESFKKHGIEVQVPEIDLNLAVLGQETQLCQLLVNLLSNAKDAVLPLSQKWIRIEVLDRKDSVEIAVTDSGPGIPQDLREKVMEPFFTTKPMGKGSGLGLSVCSTIVRHHSGKIWVDPECPNTRFVVRLPKGLSD